MMNHPFAASSLRTRSAFALVALLISLTLGAAIDGLADHGHHGALAQASSASTPA